MAAAASISMEKADIPYGAKTIPITCTNTSGKDWICLYRADTEDIHEYLDYVYWDSPSFPSGQPSRMHTDWPLPEGDYVAVLYENDTWTSIMRYPFSIVENTVDKSIALSAQKVALEDSLTITCRNTTANDYICILPSTYSRYDEAVYTSYCTASALTVSAADLGVGKWTAILFRDRGWNEVMKLSFEVAADLEKGLSIGSSTIIKGEPIELTYKNTDGSESIGIYPEVITNYIDDRKIAITCTSASLTKVTPSSGKLEPGNYVAILWEPGWKEVARCAFTLLGGNACYVSSSGSDTNAGTEKSPVKTISAAQKKFNGGNGCITILDQAVYDSAAMIDYTGTITIVGKSGDAKLLYGNGDFRLRSDTVLRNLTLGPNGGREIFTNGYSLKIDKTVTLDSGEDTDRPIIVTGKNGTDYEKIALIGGAYGEIVIGRDGGSSDSAKILVDGAEVQRITVDSANDAADIRAALENGTIAAVTITDEAAFASLQMVANNGSKLQTAEIRGKTWYILSETDEKGRVDLTDTVGTFDVVSSADKTPVAVSKDGNQVYVAGEHTSTAEKPKTDYQYNDFADYIQYRKALTHTYQKLTEDKELRIVYFGGSVTAGYGSSNGAYSWRGLSEEWFRNTFPDADITAINTAIGESGTFLGTYRLQKDVIDQKPDLLFIEYAINDKYKGSSEEVAALQYETIVREVKQALPQCDIVTLLVTDRSTADLMPDLYPTASGHEKMAALYDISTVNVGKSLVDSMKNYKNGQEWGQYFIDTVHPTDAGYRKYYDCLEEFLKNSLLCTDFDGIAVRCDDEIPVQSAYLLDGDRRSIMGEDMKEYVLSETKGFSYSTAQYYGPAQTPHNGFYYARKAVDAEIAFRFSGTEFAIWTNFYQSSQIRYSVDGGDYKTIACDNHAPTQIVSGLTAGEHVIRIRPITYGSDTGDIMKIGAVFTRDAAKQTTKGTIFPHPDTVNGTFTLPAGQYTVRYLTQALVSALPVPEAKEGYRFIGWKNADGALVPADTALEKGTILTASFVEEGHSHSADNGWQFDEKAHWGLCSCGTVLDKAVHHYGEWIETKAATATQAGSKERTCLVCGYKEQAIILPQDQKPSPSNDAESPKTGWKRPFFWMALALICAALAGSAVMGGKEKRRHEVL